MNRCIGKNRIGNRCGSDAVKGSKYCKDHQDQDPKFTKEMVSKDRTKSTISKPVYLTIISILAGLVITLGIAWRIEVDSHNGTNSELLTANTTIRRLNRELKKTDVQLDELKRENKKLMAALPLLELFGPDVSLVSRIDLKKEKGAYSVLGNCPNAPCVNIRFEGRTYENGEEIANIGIGGKIGESIIGDKLFLIGIPIIKGAKRRLSTPIYDFTIAIEEDRINQMKLAIGMTPGTFIGDGIRIGPVPSD